METYAGAYPAVLAGGGRSIYVVNEMPVWQEYGWWLMLMVGGTYFLFMDVKLMQLMINMRRKRNGSGIV